MEVLEARERAATSMGRAARRGTKIPTSRVTVAVVNYNTLNLLRSCLTSAVAEHPAVIIVVDNASPDGSAAMVADEFPSVTLLANEENVGYGAAANQAMKRIETPYMLLLNADTFITPGGVQSLSKYLDEHPNVGMVGPRLLNLDGSVHPSCFPFPGSMRWAVDNDDVGRLVAHVPGVRNRAFRTWPHDRSRRVPWVMGAALCIRREAADAVAGFDPDFFMYHEESDLAYRMADAGWETHFTPDASVIHVGGASTVQVKAEMTEALFASTERFHRKHYDGLQLAAASGAWHLLARARYLGALVGYWTKGRGARAQAEGKLDLLRRIATGSKSRVAPASS